MGRISVTGKFSGSSDRPHERAEAARRTAAVLGGWLSRVHQVLLEIGTTRASNGEARTRAGEPEGQDGLMWWGDVESERAGGRRRRLRAGQGAERGRGRRGWKRMVAAKRSWLRSADDRSTARPASTPAPGRSPAPGPAPTRVRLARKTRGTGIGIAAGHQLRLHHDTGQSRWRRFLTRAQARPAGSCARTDFVRMPSAGRH